MTTYGPSDPDGDTFGKMGSDPEPLYIGDYIVLNNAKGDPIVRMVYVGDDKLLEHRRYRSILTNEMSDWRPADKATPKQMTNDQKAEFTARKAGRMPQ